MISFLKEFWAFLRARKKYWLLPILIMMLIFGGLLVLTSFAGQVRAIDPRTGRDAG